MNEDLGFSPSIFGIGAGIFFAGYILFEVPSNLALQRFGARIWIARIMISWGLVATAMALVSGETSFYVMRFLLGVAEAGFFPGIVLYLTYWFPARERARIVALFMTAVPLATMVGGPISGALLEMHGGTRAQRLAMAVHHRGPARDRARADRAPLPRRRTGTGALA
jgi:ACS family tartrate transporter-like MFS transporter